ncbi:hypothetical protein [Lacipirellula limnantheis]|uniref:hypothetical protein n=1 Tax=Lacipirellula limnantheis TaxID=2528024 RepID=UPI0011A365FF|nr:hypothetical protein [Lacipirellula limnantheis]
MKRIAPLLGLLLGLLIAIYGFAAAEVMPLAESEKIVRIFETTKRDDVHREIQLELLRVSRKIGWGFVALGALIITINGLALKAYFQIESRRENP